MLKHKDKAGIPGRVALALQADGWWWRSTIIWAKGVSFCDEYAGACMPESVKDRPTRAHEYLFLFSKSRYYFYDHDAVRERSRTAWNSAKGFSGNGKRGAATGYDGAANNQFNSTGTHEDEKKSGRNLRDVWTINPAGYPGAHFATFPPELVTPCVLAGTSQRGVCPECGAPWGRQTQRANKTTTELRKEVGWTGGKRGDELPPMRQNLDLDHSGRRLTENLRVVKTVGWESTCEHDLEPVPAIVLDPFAGSGTVGEVCRGTGRRFMGFDLYREYLETIALPRAENKQTQASIDSLPLFGGE
jgi:DNA modification methylase